MEFVATAAEIKLLDFLAHCSDAPSVNCAALFETKAGFLYAAEGCVQKGFVRYDTAADVLSLTETGRRQL